MVLAVSKMGDDLVPFPGVMVLRRFVQRYLHIRVQNGKQRPSIGSDIAG